jgi:hypothetical protein
MPGACASRRAQFFSRTTDARRPQGSVPSRPVSQSSPPGGAGAPHETPTDRVEGDPSIGYEGDDGFTFVGSEAAEEVADGARVPGSGP